MRDAFDVNAAGGDVGGYGANIDLHLYEVDQDRKLGLLEKMLVDETGSFLVFAKTKHGADRLANTLVIRGSKATKAFMATVPSRNATWQLARDSFRPGSRGVLALVKKLGAGLLGGEGFILEELTGPGLALTTPAATTSSSP